MSLSKMANDNVLVRISNAGDFNVIAKIIETSHLGILFLIQESDLDSFPVNKHVFISNSDNPSFVEV